MNFFDRLFMTSLTGKGELHWGAAAVVLIFFVLCCIGLVIYGLVSGYWQWSVIGGICAVIFVILAVVCVFLNIRKNSNRW
jgi:hypothetical protein